MNDTFFPIGEHAAVERSDTPEAIFAFLQRGLARGLGAAIVTLVAIEGGAARRLGAQMGVLSDGRWCGFVSGGCTESAVAAEAVAAIGKGSDTTIRLGRNSPFIDIRLPCGGGIDLLIQVLRDGQAVNDAMHAIERRSPFSAIIAPNQAMQVRTIDQADEPHWENGMFVRPYAPQTRLLLIGRGLELETTVRLAAGADFALEVYSADDQSAMIALAHGARTHRLDTIADLPELPIDAWTGVVLLFHDHEWEAPLIAAALAKDPFFIGALGSQRTHAVRRERLAALGVPQRQIDRVKGPIGLFGPARDASTLALSILAEVGQAGMQFPAVIALQSVGLMLLAAGLSQRYGTLDKLLRPVDGLPLALHAALRLGRMPFGQRVAVVQENWPLQEAVGATGFELAVNPQPQRGQGSSLAIGLATLKSCSAVMICLADMPFVSVTLIEQLARRFDPEAGVDAVASGFGELRSPPALLSRAALATVDLSGDAGARPLLRRAVVVEAAPEQLRDFDTPDDFAATKSH